jgi:hypothetical protein
VSKVGQRVIDVIKGGQEINEMVLTSQLLRFTRLKKQYDLWIVLAVRIACAVLFGMTLDSSIVTDQSGYYFCFEFLLTMDASLQVT